MTFQEACAMAEEEGTFLIIRYGSFEPVDIRETALFTQEELDADDWAAAMAPSNYDTPPEKL